MSLSQYSIVLTCVIFMTLHQLTVGLICYQCLTCNTIDGNTGITTVTDGVGYSCYKIIAFTSGITVVARGVMLNCNVGNVNINGITAMTYCCTGDRCNTGITLSNSFGLVIIIVNINIFFHGLIIG